MGLDFCGWGGISVGLLKLMFVDVECDWRVPIIKILELCT